VLLFGVLGVVVLVVVLLIVMARETSHGLTGPPVPSTAAPGPIVIIPGYGGSTSGPDALAATLRRDGRDVTVVGLPDGGTGDLTVQAHTVGHAVHAALGRSGAASVDLVGYSAGSVVARIFVQQEHGFSVVRRVVTFGAPNHGTDLAATAANLVPGSCTDACAQLQPSSSLLATLNSLPLHVAFASLYTEDDQTVTPPTTAVLQGAVNIDIQHVCPGVRVSHGGLPTNPHVQAIVAAELGTTPQAVPATCPTT
jgi:triacylglycerol esterase/lipase EstA (alpha/beta hydrolase family)